MNFLHSTNVNELATIAAETGAEVLRGPLRYPSESGGWRLADLSGAEVTGEQLAKAISLEGATMPDGTRHE